MIRRMKGCLSEGNDNDAIREAKRMIRGMIGDTENHGVEEMSIGILAQKDVVLLRTVVKTGSRTDSSNDAVPTTDAMKSVTTDPATVS
jgi:hypothetical protein